jgi:hypothetical protein
MDKEQDEQYHNCVECELGNHNVPAFKLCAWCKNHFCNECAKKLLKFKDDEGNIICSACYDDALMEARAEAKSMEYEKNGM